jgi:hypothetical protein
MSSPVNLYYVRAAIEANTGIRLSLKETKKYLIEEGMITDGDDAYEFRGYSEYYWMDDATSQNLQEDPQDVKEDINLALRLMENTR